MRKSNIWIYSLIILLISFLLIQYFGIKNLHNTLEEREREIKELQKKYDKKIEELKELNKSYEKSQEQIYDLTSILKQYNLSLEIKENEIESLERRLENLIREKEKLEKEKESIRRRYKVVNPYFSELLEFIRKDPTESNEWSEEYDCTEFSNTFVRNFEKEGYFSCVVELNLYDGIEEFGHMIVAVKTQDVGLVYVEPQSDDIIYGSNLRVGENYCDLVGWDCYWEITKISSCFSYQY